MAIGFYDFAPVRLPRRGGLAAALGLLLASMFASPAAAHGQYPGQLTKSASDVPVLRAISVLEWTGDEGHPKACRLVPVVVFDGKDLQDGGIYLARPQPLALAGEVEYELERNGKPFGLYDIRNTGLEQGSWVGYGAWKTTIPKPPKQKITGPTLPLNPSWNDEDDRPTLHRKHHADDAPAGSTDGKTAPASAGTGSSTASTSAPASDDPDRPTLHKKADSGSTSQSPTASTAPQSSDPDRPTLHKKTDDSKNDNSSDGDTQSAQGPAPDPDRPVLHKAKPADDTASNQSAQPAKKKKKDQDIGHVDSIDSAVDPDRPRLKRGKTAGSALDIQPSLLGLPPDMKQAVAVSDERKLDEHQWSFAWSDPAYQDKMKAALEDKARDALGLTPPSAPAPAKRIPGRRPAKSVAPPPPPAPAPLAGEDFRVFELAYGAGATMVLSAHTGGQGAAEKFVTLIAQPDLYGNLLVLEKSVTDAAHLDDKPRLRLVDAVDAQADNRGELLFELRGETQRQFAIYRVLRGEANRIFTTTPADIVAAARTSATD